MNLVNIADLYKTLTIIGITRHIKVVFFVVVACVPVHQAHAQSGCNHPDATNYDEKASVNDGSCQFPIRKLSLDLSHELDSKLDEVSGVEVYDQMSVLTLNDGGNGAELFRISQKSGQQIMHIEVEDKKNHDWEDLAQSDDAYFIGDFGNNADGNRKNLKVLRIEKSEFVLKKEYSVSAKSIKFHYPEQDFSQGKSKPQTTEWDCEALIWWKGELHLFTKDWKNKRTRHYTLPDKPGEYEAKFIEEFDVNGMVTAADITPDGKLVLLGYNSLGKGFVWEFWHSPNGFFQGHKRKYNLGSVLMVGQVESLIMLDEKKGIIMSERFERKRTKIPPRAYNFELLD